MLESWNSTSIRHPYTSVWANGPAPVHAGFVAKLLHHCRRHYAQFLIPPHPATGARAGAVLPLQRKQEIYAIACEFDLLLLEDDPYYILQFRNGAPK